MKKLQQGFTLIELMIVVAIIGILAAIAVPAYQDYTVRSRVSEGASLASAARTAIDVAFSEGIGLSTMATSHANLGISQPGSYKGKYVSMVSMAANGKVVVQLSNSTDLPATVARGTQFVYIPTSRVGNLEWSVSVRGLAQKYAPKR